MLRELFVQMHKCGFEIPKEKFSICAGPEAALNPAHEGDVFFLSWLIDEGKCDARMRAAKLDDIQIIIAKGKECVLVRGFNMIALQETLEMYFPIGLDNYFAFRKNNLISSPYDQPW